MNNEVYKQEIYYSNDKTRELEINILTVQNSDFKFSIYCNVFSEYKKDSDIYFTRMNDEIFGVSLFEYKGFELREFNSLDNIDLTKWYIYNLLVDNCKKNRLDFYEKNKFQKTVNIELLKDNLGKEVITISPTYLNSQKKFGFILNYRFIKNDNIKFSREIQIRSLSLDCNGNENKNFYIDKYKKIMDFVRDNFSKVFPFGNLEISQKFEQISSSALEIKKYQFGGSNINNSQFQGVKSYGPFLPIDISNSSPKLCFVYRNNEKNYSYKLYDALFGKLYPTFSGMENMFHFSLNKSSVIGEGVDEYTEKNISELISKIREKYPSELIVPILIVPWSKENANEQQQELYYKLKHLFLIHNMPSQFVSINKIINDSILKWSVSSLAIQIFSKLGGSPWVVRPKTSNCLIIGIGQAYQRDENSKIKKFFSYSILTDTTGLFKGIKILANTNSQDDYAANLAKSLKDIVGQYSANYDSFVIHTSFRINKRDIKTIKMTLDEIRETEKFNFSVLRFDDCHDYLCFDKNFNSLVPLESTKVQLSKKDWLIWFEGQQYGQSAIRHRIGAPMRVSIDYPKDISNEKIADYLQDAINLSGANWRGFNAKSIPVSLLYAHLISQFVSAFDKYSLSEIDIEKLTPWFL